MLFIQSLNTYYEKQERSSEYARLRTGDLFRKIDVGNIHECEVFAQMIDMHYDTRGGVSQAKAYREKFRKYGTKIFTEGTMDRFRNYNELMKFIRIFKEDDRYRIMFCDENVEWCPTKRRGHNEAFNDKNSIYYHRDRLNETAFVLEKGEYGRIIYNNRYVDPDNQHWYNGWHIYNIISCDISECKEKMFFRKQPDHEYRQLLDLR
ncbi:hypothetical protein [Ruminococcus sp.]|uniref:hypothetical protein n=1 Tax=Ruminococcus sp. TaxID=41978 RepID=UPI0025EA3047|nr:hypothetical protein [Ruminococcus sp.]MBQ8967969.1 hypothetical protein [Ruminococcus sp.]